MKVTFVAISSRLPQWLEQLAADYQKRMSLWLPTDHVLLESPGLDRDSRDKKIKLESEKLLNFFKADDFVLLCDEQGTQFESVLFARRLEKTLAGGKKRLCVVIGGSYGVTEGVRKRADLLLSLSQFTMTHHLALAVALEQVYRAMTILKGKSYHNA